MLGYSSQALADLEGYCSPEHRYCLRDSLYILIVAQHERCSRKPHLPKLMHFLGRPGDGTAFLYLFRSATIEYISANITTMLVTTE